MFVCHSPSCPSLRLHNPQGRFTSTNPAHPYAQMESNSRPASWNSSRDPTVGGVFPEGSAVAPFGDQSALLELIQRLILGLTTQVANLSQQLQEQDKEFKELQSLVEEVNQTISQGVHTPETQPP
ncbi:unnamed protein product [Rhizoctonia solani]|uniref:Uncharacterized protein n=1 Tax=Rhizoctonia solani TaxID=456999 RepID=A0A8H3BJM1_9AGAM|nr:unnamed protein product [Rhizoctonia solani]